MPTTSLAATSRYFEAVGERRAKVAEAPPVCLYLEVTNRCNLLCETCPRTFEALEPPADMSWELFTSIVDQVPDVARVVLHGVGEPMLVKSLPAHDPLSQGARHLRAVQHQRHAAGAAQAPRDSSRPVSMSCASRLTQRRPRAS